MKTARTYSPFWSDREFLHVKGIKENKHAEYYIRAKLTKVAQGLKEVENPDSIPLYILKDLCDAISHLLKLKGFVEQARIVDETIVPTIESVSEVVSHA